MEYYVAGSNLFNQWFDDLDFFSEFRKMSKAEDPNFDFRLANLIQINWSYNIFQLRKNLYLLGAFDGRKIAKKIDIPEECRKSPLVAGNDYNLVIGHNNSSALWILNLEDNSIKNVYLDRELPLEVSPKRNKTDNEIQKLAVNNFSCLYLTKGKNVYSGILPSYIDTSHCNGHIIDVVCGYEHYMLLTSTGYVYTWGDGRRLQLGQDDTSNLETPTQVEALAGIKIIKIKAGGWHSMALSEFGDLYVWGLNDTGQLGIKESENDLKSYALPKLVDLYDDNEEVHLQIKDIACGSKHSVLLLEDGSVWTTGANKYGQLACPQYPNSKNFNKVCVIKEACRLKCGPWTTVIVCKDT
ncbi:RCC1 and BTB domain-containing protein 2-like [Bombyx mandarina]|uniref:RCC1 and BTB domain-containing protein 2-like n=1 Tax=Bombyx mandarina TaxID=7092 RepID=A0A6J2JWD8_BOMMA|nr:RCC1 and BTB domain-containing protein 2-like [Bombyx mandarina]